MSNQEDEDNPNIFEYEGGLPIFKARLQKVELKQEEAEARERTYRDQQLAINRSMMRFTGALVLLSTVTIALNGIYTHVTSENAQTAKSTAEIARETLREVQRGGSDTHDVALAAKDQANAAEQTARAAEQTISNAQNTFHLEQRAWIGVTESMQGGDQPKVTAVITNTGRTPAFDVIQSHSVEHDFIPFRHAANPLTDEIRIVVKQISKPDAVTNRGTIPPGGAFPNELPVINPALVVATGPEKILYIVRGTIHYRDVFHRKHWTNYCFYRIHRFLEYTGLNSPQFSFCPYGNDTDDNPEEWPPEGKAVIFK